MAVTAVTGPNTHREKHSRLDIQKSASRSEGRKKHFIKAFGKARIKKKIPKEISLLQQSGLSLVETLRVAFFSNLLCCLFLTSFKQSQRSPPPKKKNQKKKNLENERPHNIYKTFHQINVNYWAKRSSTHL